MDTYLATDRHAACVLFLDKYQITVESKLCKKCLVPTLEGSQQILVRMLLTGRTLTQLNS